MHSRFFVRAAWTAVLGIVGCSSASDPGGFSGGSGSGGAGGGSGGGAGSGGDFNLDGGPSDGGILQGEPPCDKKDPNGDNDGDGYTVGQGDCNDCTAQMNPGAYDYPGNGVDEDCNGTKDDEPTGCDQGLPIAANDPFDGAKAIGLCKKSDGKTWGVVSAKWVFADGSTASQPTGSGAFCVKGGSPPNPLSRGVVPKWGSAVKTREGATMLALSSGAAREGKTQVPGSLSPSPDGATMCTASPTPSGFPKDSPACPNVKTAQDKNAMNPSALELQIKTPTNAKSFSFDFDFYTFEWPGFVCTQYNDFFVALLTSKGPGTPGDGNISFDSQGNPVSVNNAFVEVCDPAVGAKKPGGKAFACKLGTGELAGTGFEGHAATSWLVTKANIVPGETITMRFAVWDMGDEILDSTVLVDNFKFDVFPAGNGPVTQPVK